MQPREGGGGDGVGVGGGPSRVGSAVEAPLTAAPTPAASAASHCWEPKLRGLEESLLIYQFQAGNS